MERLGNGVFSRVALPVLVMLLLVLTLSVIPAAAQSNGAILGVVKDTSGAVIPNANITVTNAGTNETRTATSGDDGAYRVPGLDAGAYTVKFEVQGFKTMTITSLTLDVAQELVVNGTMQVGGTEQAVSVTGEAVAVDTTTSSVGSLVNDQQISQLPLNGRDYLDLTFLQPGVNKVNFPVGGGAGASGNWYSSNGAPPRSNTFTLDGSLIGNAYNTGPNSEANTTLGLDGIKEFKVLTSLFDASYPMTMGSQMVMVSKGGTNQWHGDAFEYLRNNHMDARNFFDAPPSLLGGRDPQFKRNNFGGSAGGPIQKDKTFFYLVYEGLRLRQQDAIQDRTLPPGCHIFQDANGNIYNDSATALPAGLLSAFPNGLPANPFYTSTGKPITQTPGTTWFAPGPGETDPFGNPAPTARLYSATASGCSGLTGSSVVPQVIVPWIGQMPYPNEPSINSGLGYYYPGETGVREDYSQLRIDHTFSSSDTMFVRYTFDDAYEPVPYGNLNNGDTGTGYPQYTTVGRSRNQWLTIGENHIFSAATLNQVRVSWDRTNFSNWQKNFVTSLNPFGQVASDPWFIALTGVDSATSVGPGSGTTALAPTGAPTYHIQNIGTLGDDLFYTKGKHAIKVGTLMNMFQEPNVMQKGTYGSISFASITNFMQGIPSQFLTVQPAPGFVQPGTGNLLPPYHGNYLDRDFLFKTFGFYFQDDYRVSSRITLNLGLRYEFMTTPQDVRGVQSTIPDLATSTTYRIGPIMDNPTFRNWSPRIGVAWDVFGNGKTALRSGFGIYYDVANIGSILTQNSAGVPPFGVQTTVFNTNSGCASAATCAVLSSQNFPFPLSFPASESGRALQMVDYNLKSPHSLQYNLTVQQQLPLGLALSVGYVGNRGINLYTDEDGNPVVPAGFNNGVPFYSVPNGLAQCYNNAFLPGSTTPPFDFTKTFSSTITSFLNTYYPGQTASSSPCRYNPYWSSTIFITARSNSWYNALQVTVNKRVTHGLSFQAAYTWSKAIDTTSGQMFNTDCGNNASAVGDVPTILNLDKGLACFDSPQSVHFNTIYHFPVFQSDHGFVSKALNGWWVSSIVSAQTGFPFSVLVSTERSFDGVQIAQNPGDRADLNTAGQSFTTNLPVTAGSTQTAPYTYNFIPYNPSTVITGNVNNYFNPLMFGVNALGTLGDSARDILRGPGLGDWDFSLVKDTRLGFLGEAGNLEFRAEVFNLLNRPNFGNPNNVAYTGATTSLNGLLEGRSGIGTNEAPPSASIADPFGTAGQITTTTTSSRQIQLALKVIF